MADDFDKKEKESTMMRKICGLLGILMVFLAGSTAGAQAPNVQAWIDGPKFLTPGSPDEDIWILFRNK